MTFDGSINGIDHVQCAPRGAAVLDVPGFYVEGEKLGGHSSLFHPGNGRSVRSRRSSTEVEIVVRHRRCDVVVGVYDDGAAMDLKGTLPESLVSRLGEDRSDHRQPNQTYTYVSG